MTTKVKVLLERAHGLGAELIYEGDSIRVRAPEPLPRELMEALRGQKPELLELLKPHRDWVLEVWAREVTPIWQRVFEESIAAGDRERARYARWMLREVLGVNPDGEGR